MGDLSTDLALSFPAGLSCQELPVTPKALEGTIKADQGVCEKLDQEQGSSVAIIGRQGQYLSKYGFKYSYVGIGYKAARKKWSVVKLLTDCGSANSDLWEDGLGSFF